VRWRRRRYEEHQRLAPLHPSFRIIGSKDELRSAASRAAAAERESAKRFSERAERYEHLSDDEPSQ